MNQIPSDGFIDIEVAYALPDKQVILPVRVQAGTTVANAVQNSGIDAHFDGLVIADSPMGIFGKAVRKPAEQVVLAGERIELYRPLIIDPKQARANRAAKAAAAKTQEKRSGSDVN